jgi:hypothetical protein
MHPTQQTHAGKVFTYRTMLVSAHTATNVRCTGIGNSDAGDQGTVHQDAARQGTLRPDEECHGIYILDKQCQGIFLPDVAGSSRRSRTIWTQSCLPDAAVSSGRSHGYWTQPCLPDSRVIWMQPWLLNAAVASGRSAWLLGLRTQTTQWQHSGHGGGVITAKTSITRANT